MSAQILIGSLLIGDVPMEHALKPFHVQVGDGYVLFSAPRQYTRPTPAFYPAAPLWHVTASTPSVFRSTRSHAMSRAHLYSAEQNVFLTPPGI